MSLTNIMSRDNRWLLSFLVSILLSLSSCGGGGGGGGSAPDGPARDTISPDIVSTVPNESERDVSINSLIIITFNEALESDTINNSSIVVTRSGSSVSGVVTLSPDGKIVTFTPNTSFQYSSTYSVKIDSSISDLAGNSMIFDGHFQFYTGSGPDLTPPVISSTYPANNSTGFIDWRDITVTFNEAMSAGTINGTNIKLMKGAEEVEVSITYNSGTRVVTINPRFNLEGLTDYVLKISTGVTDSSNNALASEYILNFRTAADTSAPILMSTTPRVNAVNVPQDIVLSAWFNEKLNPATVNTDTVTLKKYSDNTAVSGTVQYDASNCRITFTPDSSLEADPTKYTVNYSSGIKDLAGNAYTGVGAGPYNFTVSDGISPEVIDISHANGSSNHSVKNPITITFNKAMDSSSLSSGITVRNQSGVAVSGSVSYNSDTRTASFTPVYNMNYQQTYTITVSGSVKDISNNNLVSSVTSTFTTKSRAWTIMYYGDADCDLEASILNDVAEMKLGYVDDQGLDLIVLIDRHPNSNFSDGYSNNTTVFGGSDFSDTRMYRITNGKAERISGGSSFSEITGTSNFEGNIGDANTLKKFIQSCKSQFPADKYALILSNHGGGSRSAENKKAFSYQKNSQSLRKEICYDETNGDDVLNTAEFTDILTPTESVDLFGLDACLMSSIEFAYQFRTGNGSFNASIMVASAPTEWGNGWDYVNILNRLKSGGGNNGTTDQTLGDNELYYDPLTLTSVQLGAVIVEEQRDSTTASSSESLTCLDLSKVAAVKNAVDSMAVALWNENKKSDLDALRRSDHHKLVLGYFSEDFYNSEVVEGYLDWLNTPFFDLYNLSAAINASTAFSNTIRAQANSVMTAVDDLVLYSFANADYTGFIPGLSGVHIFYPYGDDTIFLDTDDNGSKDTHLPHWLYQVWYNAKSASEIRLIAPTYTDAPYGKLAWCINGRNTAVNAVGNWFELLDCWYDDILPNDQNGGLNYYQW